MSTLRAETTHQYFRPKDNEEALQDAIRRWIDFQHRVWEQESKRSGRWLEIGSTLLRIIILILAGSVTVLSTSRGQNASPGESLSILTIISGTLTILTGIESFLKLSDRKVNAENRRAAILAEYDRQGYEWMVKVELETDTDKAFEEAKHLLEISQNAVNDIVSRYVARKVGDEPSKGSTSG